MAEKITKELYSGKVLIDFWPASHRYRIQGDKSYLISATGATGMLDKSRPLKKWAVELACTFIREYLERAEVDKFTKGELMPIIAEAEVKHDQKLEEAATFGSMVHDFAEKFAIAKMAGEEVAESELDDLPEPVENGINAFLDWYNKNDVKFLEIETLVYSKKHKYSGTFDAVVEIEGKRYLLDYKTSSGIYNDMKYQIACYKEAYLEEHGKQDLGAILIHFDKKTGDFHPHFVSDEDHKKDFPAFLGLLAVKRREKELQAEWYAKNKK